MNADLKEKLEEYVIDDLTSDLTFTRRLARENNWRASYAAKVVSEYKRFVFLACVAGHPVTPSDEVDQAWHLHMCYTQSYWVDMCDGILGRKLHHGPTKGGQTESNKFEDWYLKTLESYQKFYQSEPPKDIWPSVNERFSRDVNFKRVDVAKYILLPRIRFPISKCFAFLAVSFLLAGCALLDPKVQVDVMPLFLSVFFIGFVIYIIRKASGKGGKGGQGGCGGCGGGGGCGGCGGG